MDPGSIQQFAQSLLRNSNDPNVVANQVAGAGTNTTFPHDLVNPGTGRNYYIDIQFQEYQRRSIYDRAKLVATSGIQLPIPNNLRDQTGANWQTVDSTNPATGAAIESFLNSNKNAQYSSGDIQGSLLQAGSTIAKTVNGAAAGLASSALAKGANFIGQDKSTAGQLGSLFGVAQNPFMTMLYQSPAFKSHTFEWTLAPRNKSETETLNNIIQQFKSNMLPDIVPNLGGTLLTYPNMAKITIYPSGYLYDFKYCVVKDLSINFAPSGPSFFNDSGAPTQVILSVNLQEIEWFSRSDITGVGTSPVGGIPVNQAQDIRPGGHV